MYSRGLGAVKQDYNIPEKYDGTALLELPSDEVSVTHTSSEKFIDAQKKEIKFSPIEAPTEPADAAVGAEATDTEAVGAFSFGPTKWIRKILPSNFSLDGILPKIELEELIIIGLAAFLFFSKSGDKECALMLLALIFIS